MNPECPDCGAELLKTESGWYCKDCEMYLENEDIYGEDDEDGNSEET